MGNKDTGLNSQQAGNHTALNHNEAHVVRFGDKKHSIWFRPLAVDRSHKASSSQITDLHSSVISATWLPGMQSAVSLWTKDPGASHVDTIDTIYFIMTRTPGTEGTHERYV